MFLPLQITSIVQHVNEVYSVLSRLRRLFALLRSSGEVLGVGARPRSQARRNEEEWSRGRATPSRRDAHVGRSLAEAEAQRQAEARHGQTDSTAGGLTLQRRRP